MLQEIILPDFENSAGSLQKIHVFFRFFGREAGTAPVVLVNHSLTGDADVTGEKGWWKELVGPQKCIDTNRFCVLGINVPGNGASGNREHLLHNYTEFTVHDVARIFSTVLEKLKIDSLFAAIGGSIGGALAWHLAVLKPNLIQNLIPIATDLKATDWVLGQCKVQDQILNNSVDPIHDARMHAMTFYRTPASFSAKFRRKKNELNFQFEVANWLSYHGRKLENRFDLAAYKLMNHLLTTIDVSGGNGEPSAAAKKISGNIHLVGIDSDLFFLPEEIRGTYGELSEVKENVSYHEIKSIHGHDAFLIEYEQLSQILESIFNQNKTQNEENKYSSLWNR
ncbi:alpha/beta fold hydrolase [Salinimicrobium sp. TH3]|uniref:alpha/beta fold hydrolase n=1 Tax=Salinimicrobium sp. TH3 TaxID=2997342 RepID=UPI002275D882|nr:alpha/beta fold hydrolase [Salinimicrobium sp. TH3]MCY2686046.1 alpha/beta fold hydrolase [Salinimicrobium sp. TH3]